MKYFVKVDRKDPDNEGTTFIDLLGPYITVEEAQAQTVVQQLSGHNALYIEMPDEKFEAAFPPDSIHRKLWAKKNEF